MEEARQQGHTTQEIKGRSDDFDTARTTFAHSEKDVKAPNIFERAKEEMDAIIHSGKKTHHKETHGTSDDIDENTPVNEVKAPNVFERAKEELEALVEAIHPPKKESERDSPSKKSEGCFGSLGRKLEKFCQPHDRKQS